MGAPQDVWFSHAHAIAVSNDPQRASREVGDGSRARLAVALPDLKQRGAQLTRALEGLGSEQDGATLADQCHVRAGHAVASGVAVVAEAHICIELEALGSQISPGGLELNVGRKYLEHGARECQRQVQR